MVLVACTILCNGSSGVLACALVPFRSHILGTSQFRLVPQRILRDRQTSRFFFLLLLVEDHTSPSIHELFGKFLDECLDVFWMTHLLHAFKCSHGVTAASEEYGLAVHCTSVVRFNLSPVSSLGHIRDAIL